MFYVSYMVSCLVFITTCLVFITTAEKGVIMAILHVGKPRLQEMQMICQKAFGE